MVVAIDSEAFEEPERVLAHKQDNGFAGTFAVGTQEFVDALQGHFGGEIITPPTSPVVLLGPDQTQARLLPGGFKDVDTLAAELEAGP